LCELKKHVLPTDYPELDLRNMRVILIEGGGELMGMMQEKNRERAKEYLHDLGAEVWLNMHVIAYDGKTLQLKSASKDSPVTKSLESQSVIWTAGIKGVVPEGLPAEVINNRKRILVDDYCRV